MSVAVVPGTFVDDIEVEAFIEVPDVDVPVVVVILRVVNVVAEVTEVGVAVEVVAKVEDEVTDLAVEVEDAEDVWVIVVSVAVVRAVVLDVVVRLVSAGDVTNAVVEVEDVEGDETVLLWVNFWVKLRLRSVRLRTGEGGA